jgi:hypothetical protein
VIKYYVGRYQYNKFVEQQARVADPETMAEYRWQGDNAADVDMSQAELAEEIRKAARSYTPASGDRR